MKASTSPARGTRGGGAAQGQGGRGAGRDTGNFHVFRVNVSTGDAVGAGTDSRVFLTLIGVLGQSSEIELRDSLAGDNKFERGNTDEFALRISNDPGDITRIVLRSDMSALGSDWLVSQVVVTNCQNNNKYTFHCGDMWISDTMPHEFLCSERVKHDLQLQHVADNSGLLLTARLPIQGKSCAQALAACATPAPHVTVVLGALSRDTCNRVAGAKDELLQENECDPQSMIHALARRVTLAAGIP